MNGLRWIFSRSLSGVSLAATMSCYEVDADGRPAAGDGTGESGGAASSGQCVEQQLGLAGLCLDAGMWALEAFQACADQGLYLARFSPADECGVGLFESAHVACCGGDGRPDSPDRPETTEPDRPPQVPSDDPCGVCPPDAPYCMRGADGQPSCSSGDAPPSPYHCPPEAPFPVPAEDGTLACSSDPGAHPPPAGCSPDCGAGENCEDGCQGSTDPACWTECDASGECWSTCEGSVDDPTCPQECDSAGNCWSTCGEAPNPGVECWTDCDAAGNCWTKCSDGTGSAPPTPPAPAQTCEWMAVQGDQCLPYDVLKHHAYEQCAASGRELTQIYPAEDCPGGSTIAKIECCGEGVY